VAEPIPALRNLTARELAEWIAADRPFTLLDVREAYEFRHAAIPDPRVRLVPLSRLANLGLSELPEELTDRQRPVVVLCHLGMRSAQVAHWLQAQGWQQVYNLSGGIDAYAYEIDPTIRRY
jgi:adenylyltransferase/sulfurtransferase